MAFPKGKTKGPCSRRGRQDTKNRTYCSSSLLSPASLLPPPKPLAPRTNLHAQRRRFTNATATWRATYLAHNATWRTSESGERGVARGSGNPIGTHATELIPPPASLLPTDDDGDDEAPADKKQTHNVGVTRATDEARAGSGRKHWAQKKKPTLWDSRGPPTKGERRADVHARNRTPGEGETVGIYATTPPSACLYPPKR